MKTGSCSLKAENSGAYSSVHKNNGSWLAYLDNHHLTVTELEALVDINQTYELHHTVKDNDLASSLSPDPEDEFPPVFATSRMIAFMEFCSARFMKPLLKEGELSVGVGIEVKHTVPTLAGEEAVISSTFLGQEDKLYRFHVTVADKHGVVGEGAHTRAIVNPEKLVSIAEKRAR